MIKKTKKSISGSNNPMYGKTHSEETRKKISDAVKGKNSGKNHYLFGKHPSNETREKQSKARKGLLIGDKNPMYGKFGKDHPVFGLKRSEETKRKISESRKHKIALGIIAINKKCGKDNPMYGKHGKDHPSYGKHLPEDICKYISERQRGPKNHQWKGGISYYPYCEKFDEKRKTAVRNFFNGLCLCCGEYQYKRKHQVHHIHHDKNEGCNKKPFNLVPLCNSCHAKELHNIEDYKKYINNTLQEGFKWGIWNEQEYKNKVMY